MLAGSLLRNRRRLGPLVVAACLGACGENPQHPEVDAAKPSPGDLHVRRERHPARHLAYDDGTADLGHGFPRASWQLATVFRNPYPVPARVDTLWIFFHGSSGITAPFQFGLWAVNAQGRPTTALELSPEFGLRAPLHAFGIFRFLRSVLPPFGVFAAGMRANSEHDLVAVGQDTTSAFQANTFFVSVPAGSPDWLSLEQVPPIVDEVPMIRVSLSPVYAARAAAAPPAAAAAPGYETMPARPLP